MALHRVDLRTYFRILSCAVPAGIYLGVGVAALVLYLNPSVPTTPNVLAHLLFYLLPSYAVGGTVGFTVVGWLLQPFLVRPLARRVLDPVSVSWLLLVDLALLAAAYWANHEACEELLSGRQGARLLRASLGLTVLFAFALTAHAYQFLFPVRRRRARIVLVCLAAVGALAPFLHRRQSVPMPRRHTLLLDAEATGTPMRILAIDGLSLGDLRHLEASGALPSWSRLLTEGTAVSLESIAPGDAPVTWSTVATGKLPWRHGVPGAYQYELAGLEHRFRIPPRYVLFRRLVGPGIVKAVPVTREARRTLAFWNVLSRTGLSIGLVNWPISYPAEPLRGFVVSDYIGKPYFQFGTALSGVTHPDRLAPLAVRHRVRAEDISGALLDALLPVPTAATGDPELKRLRAVLAEARARDLTTRALALLFGARHQPRVLVMRFDGLDLASRYFLRYHRPEAFGDVPAERVQRYGRVIPSYYAFLDGIIGEQLRGLPEGGILMVVSAAGIEPLTTVGRVLRGSGDPVLSGTSVDAPDGVLLIWGRDVAKGSVAGPRHIADVAPTILYAQGLPIARDMDGEPVFEAFTEGYKSRTPVSIIGSYETAAGRRAGGMVSRKPAGPTP